MTHEFDLARELSSGLEDRAAAWEFIRGFARHWLTPLGEADGWSDIDGWSDADLDAAEARLGIALPEALREAYQLIGRRADLTSNQDVLLGPAQLHLDERQEALVFRHENQGAASWGILTTDLDHADPGVVIRADLADKRAEKWEGWLDRISLTFIEIVLSESLQAPEGRCDFLSDHDDPGEAGVDLLERHYAPLPFPEYPSGQKPPGIRWFLGPDVLLRDDQRVALLARARTEAALDRVRDRIPGDWLNAPR